MIALRNRLVARVLAAVLLLAFYPTASKVVCVSPTGHCSIEDWASLCCAPLTYGGTALSGPTLCQGCTDYPVIQATEIDTAQLRFHLAPHHDLPVLLAQGAAQEGDTIVAAPEISPQHLREPITSTPATSLRC